VSLNLRTATRPCGHTHLKRRDVEDELRLHLVTVLPTEARELLARHTPTTHRAASHHPVTQEAPTQQFAREEARGRLTRYKPSGVLHMRSADVSSGSLAAMASMNSRSCSSDGNTQALVGLGVSSCMAFMY